MGRNDHPVVGGCRVSRPAEAVEEGQVEAARAATIVRTASQTPHLANNHDVDPCGREPVAAPVGIDPWSVAIFGWRHIDLVDSAT